MSTSRAGIVVAWILSALLALAFLASGIPKLLTVPVWAQKFTHWGYPGWFLLAIGTLEIAGAILLLIPRWTRYGALVLAAVMIGATYTHLKNGEGLQVLRPLICLACLGLLFWLRAPDRRQLRSAG
jgi:uncharacterized membrane protein YphA (DoxX/SURF4 family)